MRTWLHLKAPQPATAWDTLNATSLPNWCPQSEKPPKGLPITVSEDCLYLNVYQPKVSALIITPNTMVAHKYVISWTCCIELGRFEAG